ncbi:unnamed protein product [Camellia sinensis]
MSQFQSQRRVHYDDDGVATASETLENDGGGESSMKLRPSSSNVTEDQEPFMGVKIRRKASRHRDYRGDYIDLQSRPHLIKVLDKQGNAEATVRRQTYNPVVLKSPRVEIAPITQGAPERMLLAVSKVEPTKSWKDALLSSITQGAPERKLLAVPKVTGVTKKVTLLQKAESLRKITEDYVKASKQYATVRATARTKSFLIQGAIGRRVMTQTPVDGKKAPVVEKIVATYKLIVLFRAQNRSNQISINSHEPKEHSLARQGSNKEHPLARQGSNKEHLLGDKKVLFADKVLKFTGSGKMKRRILLITDFAIYMVDPETDALKRRIALSALEKLCLSELSDNFFAFIIPTEYDILMASTRKTEIVTVLVEAIKSTSDYEVERFEYNASADLVKEVQFEEVEVVLKQELCGNELRLPPNVMRKRVAYSFRIKGDGLFSGCETKL